MSPSPETISPPESISGSFSSLDIDGITLEDLSLRPVGIGHTGSNHESRRSSRLDISEGNDSSPADEGLDMVVNLETELRIVFQLPPVDTGRAAWGFVLGATLVEGLTWGELNLDFQSDHCEKSSRYYLLGFVFSFGVFQKYLSSQGPFKDSKAISTVGTVTSGIAYLSAPFVQRYITSPYPAYRQIHMLFGLFCCVCGLVVASFVKEVRGLLSFQTHNK